MSLPFTCRQPAQADHARLYEILVEELIDFVVFLLDPTGCIVSWNSGVKRVLGYGEEEWLGQPAERIFTPEDRMGGKPQEEMTKAAREGRAPNIRWHLRKNGERLYVEGTLVALRDEAGQLLGFSKVMRDITEHYRNEQRNAFLVRLDDALRPLTDPNEMMHVSAQLLGEHLQVDRCTYCHVQADEETLDVLWDYCRPGVLSIQGRYRLTQFGAAVAHSLRAEQPCVVKDSESDPSLAEVRDAYRQAGVRSHATVPLRKAGRLVAIMAVHQQTPRQWRPDEVDLIRPVTNRCWEFIERARTAADLRDNQARLGAALAVAQLGTFEWDLRTEAVRLDDRSRAIFGFQPNEGTRAPEIFARIDPTVLGRVQAEAHASQQHGSRLETEYPIQLPDGSVRTIISISDAVREAGGTVKRMFGVFSDITDRKQAEEDLRRSHRELEEFAYVASHDLQEPLRMVNIYTQLILKRVTQEDTTLDEYAGFVRSGVTRMEGLLRDLLTYSRTVHREPLPVGTADLSIALSEAVSVLQNRIEESGATITATALPTVRGDTKQWAHVFQNLLANSIKYRHPERAPELCLATVREGRHWIVSVRDNGIGFKPQYAEQIFGLFKRLHKDEYAGTGLGLAICQRIVERYGGRLWAEGRPGQGATFFFVLPSAEEN